MVFIYDHGQGYVTAPQVHFVGGSGSGATGTAQVYEGGVNSILVVNSGSGYTTPPTIQIDPPPAVNAALTDQTNATLTLPAVTSANITNYFVVVTNYYGSVTSLTAALYVFLPPQGLNAQNLTNGVQLQFTGTPYYYYYLQSATNLSPPVSWQTIVTNLADGNGNWQFTDTNVNGGQKFYRSMGK